MKITVGKLKRLIREASTNKSPGKFAACVFDPETEEWRFFAKGTKAYCKEAATKMASLVNIEFVTKTDVEDEEGDFRYEPSIAIMPASEVAESLLSSTVEKAQNVYGGSPVRCCYQFEIDGGDDEDRTYFCPTENSVAKPGDKMFMVVFHGNVPGGWTMVNKEMTVAEYWQLASDEDELESDEGPLTVMKPDGKKIVVGDTVKARKANGDLWTGEDIEEGDTFKVTKLTDFDRKLFLQPLNAEKYSDDAICAYAIYFEKLTESTRNKS